VRGVFKAMRVPIHNDLLRSLLKASVHIAFLIITNLKTDYTELLLIGYSAVSEAII